MSAKTSFHFLPAHLQKGFSVAYFHPTQLQTYIFSPALSCILSLAMTPTILNDLVSKVFLDAPDKSDGKRKQNIHISYDLLGVLPELNIPTIE